MAARYPYEAQYLATARLIADSVRARTSLALPHVAVYQSRSGRPQERFAQDVDEIAEELGGAEHERPDSAASEAQLREDFREALGQLPPEQRDVFVLYEESGLSLEEIGKITGVAMETAKSRLRYAVSKLRAALRQHRPRALEPGVSS